jgi:hypothetical protein
MKLSNYEQVVTTREKIVDYLFFDLIATDGTKPHFSRDLALR